MDPVRHHLVRLVSSLALLVVALPSVPAGAASETVSDRADALLRLSGVEPQLEAMAGQVLASFDGCGVLPASVRDALPGLVGQAYAPAAIRLDMEARLVGQMGQSDQSDQTGQMGQMGQLDGTAAEHAEAALAWLRSPLGRRFTALEGVTATPEGMYALAVFTQSMDAADLPAGRRALLERLDTGSGASRFSAELASATALALALAVNETAEVPADDEALVREVARRTEGLRAGMEQAVQLAFHFVYREASDAELREYLAFVESEAGQWYHGAMNHAFIGALTASARLLGASVGAELQAERTQQPL